MSVGYWKRFNLALLAVLALTVAGCGDGLSTLTGQVTIDGKPAYEGIGLQFQPIGGSGSPSYAVTDSDGRYVAQFTHRREGIQPGKHRVSLVPGGGGGGGGEALPEDLEDVSRRPVPTAEQANRRGKLPSSYYGEITTITVEAGSNQINIALETEKPE